MTMSRAILPIAVSVKWESGMCRAPYGTAIRTAWRYPIPRSIAWI